MPVASVGACWLAGVLWRELKLDRFWAERLPKSRKRTHWDHAPQVLVCYRLIAPSPRALSNPLISTTARSRGSLFISSGVELAVLISPSTLAKEVAGGRKGRRFRPEGHASGAISGSMMVKPKVHSANVGEERCRFRAPFAYTYRMRIVTYRDLRPGRFAKPLERLRAALARGDFAAAGLKKLAPTPYWRAKLNDEARLLMQFAPVQRRNRLPVSGGDRRPRLRKVPLPAGRAGGSRQDRGRPGRSDASARAERAPGLGARSGCRRRPWNSISSTSRSYLDAAQEAVRRHAPPLVIIGPAGSGKTAVTLAKMREATGSRSLCDALGLSGADRAPALRRAWLRKSSSGRRIHELSRVRRIRSPSPRARRSALPPFAPGSSAGGAA